MEIAEFNPNAALRNLLDRSRDILDDDGKLDWEDAEKLAEYVLALDAYLRKPTSILPAVWIKPDEIPCPKCKTIYLAEPGCTGQRLCTKCEFMVDANPNRQGLKP